MNDDSYMADELFAEMDRELAIAVAEEQAKLRSVKAPYQVVGGGVRPSAGSSSRGDVLCN